MSAFDKRSNIHLCRILQGIFHIQQELYIALRAGNGRIVQSADRKSDGGHIIKDAADHLLMNGTVADNAFLPNKLAPCLELGLDKAHDFGPP